MSARRRRRSGRPTKRELTDFHDSLQDMIIRQSLPSLSLSTSSNSASSSTAAAAAAAAKPRPTTRATRARAAAAFEPEPVPQASATKPPIVAFTEGAVDALHIIHVLFVKLIGAELGQIGDEYENSYVSIPMLQQVFASVGFEELFSTAQNIIKHENQLEKQEKEKHTKRNPVDDGKHDETAKTPARLPQPQPREPVVKRSRKRRKLTKIKITASMEDAQAKLLETSRNRLRKQQDEYNEQRRVEKERKFLIKTQQRHVDYQKIPGNEQEQRMEVDEINGLDNGGMEEESAESSAEDDGNHIGDGVGATKHEAEEEPLADSDGEGMGMIEEDDDDYD